MATRAWRAVIAAMALAAGQAAALETPPAGGEVTLTGNVLSGVHTGENTRCVFLLAYGGMPEVKAEFEKVLAEFYPEKGLDADAACKLQDQFMTRLRYDVDGPIVDKLFKDAQWTVRGVMAVTGRVSEEDGRKRITATKCDAASFAFPARMLAPDKPLVIPLTVVPRDEPGDLGLQVARRLPHHEVHLFFARSVIPLDLAVGLRMVRRGQDVPQAPAFQVQAEVVRDQGRPAVRHQPRPLAAAKRGLRRAPRPRSGPLARRIRQQTALGY